MCTVSDEEACITGWALWKIERLPFGQFCPDVGIHCEVLLVGAWVYGLIGHRTWSWYVNDRGLDNGVCLGHILLRSFVSLKNHLDHLISVSEIFIAHRVFSLKSPNIGGHLKLELSCHSVKNSIILPFVCGRQQLQHCFPLDIWQLRVFFLYAAGFYIVWGCLVWVPCIYTSPALYLVKNPIELHFPVGFALKRFYEDSRLTPLTLASLLGSSGI